MNLLDGIKKENKIKNTKGGLYYISTYSSNLDVFSKLSRFDYEFDIIRLFNNALLEDEDMALANLLYILDIRNGKGERRLFKIIYKNLCETNPKAALRILPFISELGRYDYILEGIDTKIDSETVELIKTQLEKDEKSDTPSLLAKWLPSHRTHKKNNLLAKKLMNSLNMTEKEYRKTLSDLRNKINIVEKNLTNVEYDKIDFSKVPCKALMKYNNTFEKNMTEKYNEYKNSVEKGTSKINTSGLFSYEIIKKIIFNSGNYNTNLYDLMWKNQKQIPNSDDKNVLVVADTSGSMHSHSAIPYCTSVGLAIYMAERNKGMFRNHFITFSETPTLQEIKGTTITEKVNNMREINSRNTDIDKVFELIIDTARKNKLRQEELPEDIIIISDMEFDNGVSSLKGTNLEGWRKVFTNAGYNLPKIIFWNVAAVTNGVPATRFDNDVALISGFSTNILNNLFNLDNITPLNIMKEQLKPYLEMLK